MFFQCSPDPFDFPPVIASSSFNSDFFPLLPSDPDNRFRQHPFRFFLLASPFLVRSTSSSSIRDSSRTRFEFFLKKRRMERGRNYPSPFVRRIWKGRRERGGEANRTFLLPFRLNIQAIQSISLGRDARWRAKTAARSEDGFGLPAIPYLYLPSNILRRRLGNGEGGRRERERVQSRFYWFSRETGLSTFLCPAEIHREEVPFENSNLPAPLPPLTFRSLLLPLPPFLFSRARNS